MIPILYNNTEAEFKSNGVGRLSEAISCKITEERNGAFELEMTYPIEGALFKDIVPSAYVKAQNGNAMSKQVFSIYKISKPLNGIVTVYAEHISYALSTIPTSPFTASNASGALDGLKENAAGECLFNFWTDKVADGEFKVSVPTSIRSRLGGADGSILDAYGGEYEFDNYMIKLHNQRGQDNGVVLRYGKNITDIKQEENIQSTITGVYPYWLKDEEYFELPEKNVYAESAGNFPRQRVIPLDCSNNFEKKPTEEQLRTFSGTNLRENNAGEPVVSITLSFVALWQTEEYKDIAPLEKVNLCDILTVDFEKLGILKKAKVVKTVYDVLLDRYDSIEVGELKTNLASDIVKQNVAIKEKPSKNFLQEAVNNATNWITGADGGYVVFRKDANGKPYEILVMNTEDIETATKVWRWNKNGWGYSKNGYNGPYTMAATIDGAIVADFITTGTMSANRIKGGTLQLGGKSNGNGNLKVLDADGEVIAQINNRGIEILAGSINFQDKIIILSSGYISGTNAHFGAWDIYQSTLATEDDKFQVTKQSDGTWYLHNREGGCWFNTIKASDSITGKTLSISSTKKRIVDTKSYNVRSLYCYEMPSPMFGDIGHGIIGEDGLCYVDIDQIFFETIDTEQNYQVFLQSYSEHNVHVVKKQQEYFVVKGAPNTEFDWEIKAKQFDFPIERLEEHLEEDDYVETDYVALASEYLKKYEQEVLNYE